MEDRPECFGICWEPFGDSPCVTCGVRHECLDAIAKGHYPKTVGQLVAEGKEPSVENLSKVMELAPDTIQAIHQYAQRLPMVGKEPPAPEPIPEPAPKVVDLMAKEADEGLMPVEPQPVEEAVKESEDEAPKSKKGKGKAKEPKVKAPKAKKEAKLKEVPSVPQKAGPAESVAGLAETPKGKKKSAQPATEPGDTHPHKSESDAKKPTGEPRKWGKHKAQDRWMREREKNPLVAALTPGTKLRREFQDREVKVQVGAGYYLYQGEKYPTLQSVTTAATGTREYPKQVLDGGKRRKGTRMMSNWSAAKFWKLKTLTMKK